MEANGKILLTRSSQSGIRGPSDYFAELSLKIERVRTGKYFGYIS
jgi:hypothetical protein